MELNMPGWIVCPRWLYNHITAPQDNAANRVKYLESGGSGFPAEPGDGADEPRGVCARGRKEETTRDTTYRTICFKR